MGEKQIYVSEIPLSALFSRILFCPGFMPKHAYACFFTHIMYNIVGKE